MMPLVLRVFADVLLFAGLALFGVMLQISARRIAKARGRQRSPGRDLGTVASGLGQGIKRPIFLSRTIH